MITVVIPSRNTSLLTRCLRSVAETHNDLGGIDFIVIDDGLNYRPTENSGLNIRYIAGRKPFCFARNVNLGIEDARQDDDIFLMNDDTFFISSDSLKTLHHAISSRSDIGIMSPVFARTERTRSQRLGYLSPHEGVWIEETGYFTFAATYIRRSVINSVGLLDEEYTGYGYEDNDYCFRTKLEGYQLAVLPRVVMAHGDDKGRSSSTYSERSDFHELLEQNRRRFIAKWSLNYVGLEPAMISRLFRVLDMV